MSESARPVGTNRAAALELREEQRLAREGYELLDEKRVLLATEILRRLQRQRILLEEWKEAQMRAREALLAAAARHGLDGLAAHPADELAVFELQMRRRRLAGVELLDVAAHATATAARSEALNPSPEARTCAAVHLELLLRAAELGAEACTLRRLGAAYRRTERRVRAIENALLPEIEQSLRLVEEQLEQHEIEEAVRVHEAHRSAGTLP